jgi:iron complex transport system permease protein
MNLLSRFGLNGMLLALLGITVMYSLTVGPVPIATEDVFTSLWIHSEPYSVIVDQIRLPRVLLAMLVGASLGLSGAALQGLLRNPLAEPGLLGVSTSASLGAVLSLYFGLVLFSPWMLPIAAMTGAAIATLILYLIARGGASSLTLILSGVALSSLSGALTSLAINLAPTPTDLQDIVLWLLGSLNNRSYEDIRLCFPFVVVGMGMLLATGRQLNALTLGEDEASSLGINLSQLRGQVVVGTALSVGACVAVAGSIGFVGLVVPHMLRRFVQFHPSRLLFSSALGGALLLLLADTLLRLIRGNQEIMLGVVTALIGAPFFLVLVLRSRKRAL